MIFQHTHTGQSRRAPHWHCDLASGDSNCLVTVRVTINCHVDRAWPRSRLLELEFSEDLARLGPGRSIEPDAPSAVPAELGKTITVAQYDICHDVTILTDEKTVRLTRTGIIPFGWSFASRTQGPLRRRRRRARAA